MRKKQIVTAVCSVCLGAAVLMSGCAVRRHPVETKQETLQVETAGIEINTVQPVTYPAVSKESGAEEKKSLIDPDGETLEERIEAPEGYIRVPKEVLSFQGYLRRMNMKPDGSKVLLYDGSEKGNQRAHAAVFDLSVPERDLQQCADSVIRIYSEYFWWVGAYDKISFHLTNGFLMDYPSWRDGKRLSVDGNQVSWVKSASYDDSYETFQQYLKYVMIYAGTLSLDEESRPWDTGEIQAGDMFIKGGSPGHCVMVADVAEDEMGNQCFLLAQGYMPAQEFHILKNPLHEEDPWYYTSELEYPLSTPEYTFQEGSYKRWYGFIPEEG